MALTGNVEFAEGEGGSKRFSMVANSGKPFMHWFWDRFAIDLEGLEHPNKSLPVLLDHSTRQRVGFTSEIKKSEKGLVVEGQFLDSSAFGQEVHAQSKEGFPWQASVGVRALRIERVEDGETTDVNGHEFAGPGHIFRKCNLREVSFTSLGADEETSASSFSESDVLDLESLVFSSGESGFPESLSERSAGMTKPASPATAVGDAENKVDEAKLKDEAIQAERSRVSTILGLASAGQEELAQSLIKEGASVEAAAVKLCEDSKRILAERDEEVAKLKEKQTATDASSFSEPVGAEEPKGKGKQTFATWQEAWQSFSAAERTRRFADDQEFFEHCFNRGEID